jgi:putative DNA primase/helicase
VGGAVFDHAAAAMANGHSVLEPLQPPVRLVPDDYLGPSVAPAPPSVEGYRCGEDDDLPPNDHHLTDLGNARRLVDNYGADLRYAAGLGWLINDGRVWRPDETGEIERRAKQTILNFYEEAVDSDSENRNDLVKHALRSEAASRIQGMITLASSEARVVALATDFDVDPMLLNVQNGTIDLRTRTLRPHQRTDLLTKLAPVTFDPAATCPEWEKFVAAIMHDDPELIAFLQRACGYTLTGSTGEDAMLLCWGPGANGKSVFLEIVGRIGGTYRATTNFGTLTTARRDGPSEDIARLRGSRMVTAVESNRGQKFNEALVKQLTGGDTIAARQLYKGSFEFKPNFKLWLATNNKPQIVGTDDGIWRRIRLIPFRQKFSNDPEEQAAGAKPAQDKDALQGQLWSERAGILNWMLEGCGRWQVEGLGTAPDVTAATSQYRQEQDDVAGFISDQCDVGPGYKVPVHEISEAYNVWADDNDREPLSAVALGKRLTEAGYASRKINQQRTRLGLRLKTKSLTGADETDGDGGFNSFL